MPKICVEIEWDSIPEGSLIDPQNINCALAVYYRKTIFKVTELHLLTWDAMRSLPPGSGDDKKWYTTVIRKGKGKPSQGLIDEINAIIEEEEE